LYYSLDLNPKVLGWVGTYDKKVDLPTSSSPSRRTVTSGGGPRGSIIIDALKRDQSAYEKLHGGFMVAFVVLKVINGSSRR
jgi:hypothetical protein